MSWEQHFKGGLSSLLSLPYTFPEVPIHCWVDSESFKVNPSVAGAGTFRTAFELFHNSTTTPINTEVNNGKQ